jgi:hypothetical protein
MKLAVAGLAMILSAPVFASSICELPWNKSLPQCKSDGAGPEIKFVICMSSTEGEPIHHEPPDFTITADGETTTHSVCTNCCHSYTRSVGSARGAIVKMEGKKWPIYDGETKTFCRTAGPNTPFSFKNSHLSCAEG